ncbi:hypothetical protein V6N11_067637 [Hibiscus sabdariffa]|uniref:Uncharacterized protein n=1 Tax=Hibiscus sabdariffa TaxID=183260 RepID=A0ABR2SS08_9ROSI
MMAKVDEGATKPSYVAMASKGSNMHGQSLNKDGLDDMVVLAEDYVIDKSGAYPKVRFANLVHEHIDRNMHTSPATDFFKYGVYGHSKDACEESSSTTNEVQLDTNIRDTAQHQVVQNRELFGPWMVAEPYRRRVVSTPRVENGKRNDKVGSRFVVLAELVDGSLVLPKNKNVAYLASNLEKKKKGNAKTVGSVDIVPIVSEKEVEIIPHKNVQYSDNHMAFSIVEHYDGNKSPSSGKIAKARGYVGKGMKEGKRGLQIRKSAELRPHPKPNMTDWMKKLVNQLHLVEQSSNGRAVMPSSTVPEQSDALVLGGTNSVVVVTLKP